jgi:hypothetical protein
MKDSLLKKIERKIKREKKCYTCNLNNHPEKYPTWDSLCTQNCHDSKENYEIDWEIIDKIERMVY